MANLKALTLVLFGILAAVNAKQFATNYYSNNFANQAALANGYDSVTAYNQVVPGFGGYGGWGGIPYGGYGLGEGGLGGGAGGCGIGGYGGWGAPAYGGGALSYYNANNAYNLAAASSLGSTTGYSSFAAPLSFGGYGGWGAPGCNLGGWGGPVGGC